MSTLLISSRLQKVAPRWKENGYSEWPQSWLCWENYISTVLWSLYLLVFVPRFYLLYHVPLRTHGGVTKLQEDIMCYGCSAHITGQSFLFDHAFKPWGWNMSMRMPAHAPHTRGMRHSSCMPSIPPFLPFLLSTFSSPSLFFRYISQLQRYFYTTEPSFPRWDHLELMKYFLWHVLVFWSKFPAK